MKSYSVNILIISTLILLFNNRTFAQNAMLVGQVSDKATSEPLINATLKINSSGTVTDLEGRYEMELPAGKYKLEINYLGYETMIENISLSANETKQLNFGMEATPTILQTATVTSGKYEKPLGEVTVSMEILKPRLIKASNATSLDGALNKIPSVNVIDGQANIRGGSGWSYGAGSRVLLLIDDIPFLQADAGFPNWNDIPIENAEQVEIIKGAASSLYGSSALNGVINFRTGYAKSKPETKISAFHTTYLAPKDKSKKWWDDYKSQSSFNISHKQKIGKLDLVLSGFGLYNDSYKEYNFNKYGRITTGLRYRITDKLSVGFNSNFNKGESGSYFYWLNGTDGVYRGDTSSISNSKNFRYTIDPFITYFDNSGNRHKFISRYFKITNDNDGNQSNGSDLLYGEYQFQRKFEEIDLVATAGLVGIRTNVSAELYGDTTFFSNNIAPYLQLDKKLFNKLNLSGGLRYERNELHGPKVVKLRNGSVLNVENGVKEEDKMVFRFGANLQVAEYTFLRSSWGQGYRYPTIAEKYISTTAGGIFVSPSPFLESETGWSTEIGLKQGYQLSEWQGYLDIAAFWTQYQNMIEFNFDPTKFSFIAQNVGNTVIKGIDVSVVGEGKIFGNKSYLLAGYTYIDPRYADDSFDTTPLEQNMLPTIAKKNALNSTSEENYLKYRYNHTFKFDLESHFNNVGVGIGVIYNSYMKAIDKILQNVVVPGLKQYREDNQHGSTKVDVRVSYNFGHGIKATFLVNNLMNQEIMSRPGLLDAPRSLTLRVDYGF